MVGSTTNETTAGRPATRIARALASPTGVLVTVPLLVVAVGVGILLLGRDATRSSRNELVERQLRERAGEIKSQVELALDQATPLLARARIVAIHALATDTRTDEDILVRLHDLIIGRFGVAYISLSFPDGTYYQANVTPTRVEVQDSKLTPAGTRARWFTVDGRRLVPLRDKQTDYDPRKRPFYAIAAAGKRGWTQPYPFYLTNETGITCTEPVLGERGELLAVVTVDFNVNALSTYVARPALDEARSIVYAGDGVILAYPAAGQAHAKTDALLVHTDLKDPVLDALFAQKVAEPRFLELATADGDYLASVTPIAGQRAGVAVPLDWYVATIVPVRTLLGPTKQLERKSLIASAGAVALAVGLAIVLAWNLVRMRRQVAASREEARSAQARVKELGSYRLVAKLGAGGMGEVWRAEHRMLARTAAIKLIRPEALHDPGSVTEIRERFRREAQTLASMRSRHTIEIYDYGVTELGVFYYVMELLDGIDLEALVVRFGAQPPARVIDILVQACASLAEAHDAGLLHRDIKPPNLFISRAADEVDVVKLLDFGIVQSLEEPAVDKARATIAPQPLPDSQKLTQLGAMLGTPGFMAPEQILGMQLDGRSDIYALGCVAWWLLAGGEVFRREGADAKILHKHIYDPIPSLRIAVRGWCPPELENVIAACLAKEVEKRPANARELANRLKAIAIPAEHAWTEARARAWWSEYRPPAPAPSVATGDVQVIMPGRTEQRPATSDDAMGPTLAQPSKKLRRDLG